jgi:S-adenosylmethionine synthetase
LQRCHEQTTETRQNVDALIISPLQLAEGSVEVVERKGLGHPDTICDALAEALSRALCSEYRRRFGAILHHNVDKALLCGGSAAPAFKGGAVLAPIHIYLAGRAVSNVAGDRLPIAEIALESSRTWLRDNMHALDAERHVQIHECIQPGSLDLQTLFSNRERGNVALANDTSIGVGYAPLSPLERLVLAIEKRINERDRAVQNPAWGEDVKVMGIRRGEAVDLTVACAMIGRHLSHMDDYLVEKAAVAALVRGLAADHGFDTCDVVVNAADSPGTGSIYLTVTGTSAEAGDDGQVGRGNRVNGLITPGRLMSLEAAAGKNPVSHVGKLYNVVARQIAESLAATSQEIAKAECLIVSKIGAPVTEPAIVYIRMATANGVPVARFEKRACEIAGDCIGRLPRLVEEFVAGKIEIF